LFHKIKKGTDVEMKNKFYYLIMLFIPLLFQVHASERKDKTFIMDSARKAAKEHKLLVLEFWSPSCNPCMGMKRDIFENRMRCEFVDKYFHLIQLSPVDSMYNSLWNYFKLEYQSSIIYIDKSGSEIDRTVGYNGDRDAYMNLMKNIASGKNLFAELMRKYKRDTLNVLNCYLMARKYFSRYEFEEAAKLYNRILRVDPKDKQGYRAECMFKIAEMEYTLTGNLKKMWAFIDTESNYLFGPKAYLYIINDLISKKDKSKCLVTCETGFSKYPDSWEILNKYAWAICTFKIHEEYPKALSMVQKSISLNPSRPGTYSTKAWLYFEMGDKEKAIQSQKKAIEIFPDRGFIQDLEIFEKK
jgi:tetratricopeptide (TPR) repeat protein